MPGTFDVIVVGVGTAGAAACMSLAERGARVLGLERFDIPHPWGAHHGHSRMFRLAYFEHPDYVPLLRRAYDGWKSLEERSGLKIFHETGGLYMGPAGCDTVARSLRAAQTHALPHEELSLDEVRGRYPAFRLPEGFAALFEPTAGFVVPELAVAAFADRALRAGADLRGRTRVLAWSAADDGVTVRTERDTFHAAHLVLAAGAWSGPLLARLDIPLRVTRQVMGWVWPPRPDLFRYGSFPCWAVENEDQTLNYGFPMMPTNPGLKTARHWPAAETDPDRLVREPLPGDEDEYLPPLRRYLPDADGPLLAQTACLYTMSPDAHFILGHHPPTIDGHGRVTVACGFSGHGFKFAPALGDAIADLATGAPPSLPIGFLSPERFLSPAS